MAESAENRYGIRETNESDIHGEMDVWLERAVEVVNQMAVSTRGQFRLMAQWDGEGRLRILGVLPEREVTMLVFGKNAFEFPETFTDLMSYVSYGLQVFLSIDETWDRRNLLKLAEQMEKDKKERLEALAAIEEAMESIFANGSSRREAEDRILWQWSEALGENGWVRSGADLRDLTRLPILGNDSILIYRVSPWCYPHYLRVTLGFDLVIEGIAATRLSKVGEGLVTPQKGLATDEIKMVAEVLAAIAPEVEGD